MEGNPAKYTVEEWSFQLEADILRKLVSIVESNLNPKELGIAFGITEADIRDFAAAVFYDSLHEDIDRLVTSDPAARVGGENAKQYVVNSYKGVTALLSYRVANALIYNLFWLLPEIGEDYASARCDQARDHFHTVARQISEQAAIDTTVEINPSARIGPGFVIDHGTNVQICQHDKDSNERYKPHNPGTVIGETCEIGRNCTILNGVILGASEVNTGEYVAQRRHPKVGDGVTICAGAKIFGGITVGDGAWIGPGCVVSHDIPNEIRVQVLTELQYERPAVKVKPYSRVRIVGLVPSSDASGGFVLHGEGLKRATIRMVDFDAMSYHDGSIGVLKEVVRTDRRIEFFLSNLPIAQLPRNIALEIDSGATKFYLRNPPALREVTDCSSDQGRGK